MANQFEVVHLMNKLNITEQEALELIKFDKQSEALQKAKLEEIAKTQNRSFNNLVISILKDYVDNTHK